MSDMSITVIYQGMSLTVLYSGIYGDVSLEKKEKKSFCCCIKYWWNCLIHGSLWTYIFVMKHN